MNMQNMSDLLYRALAATTTSAIILKTTTRTATLAAAAASAAAAAAVAATSAQVATQTATQQATTTIAAAAAAAATTLATGGGAVSWGAAEHFYDEVDVYFATAYINDSWVTISNGNFSSSNTSIITSNNNTTPSISYGGDINQLTLINDTGVVEGVNGRNNDTSTNTTTTEAAAQYEELATLIKMLVLSIVLGLMILITIIGNVFVIAAIMLERNLQNVANYLVASLAVADLFVACLVMPLGAVYEISQGWILGPELCDIWTCCDVLCCTASILHLVAIASDRYWTVTNIDYTNFRTPRRVFFMIMLVWLASVVVSLAPQFGWKDPEYMERINQQKCMVSQDVGYQIFATCSTFYVPLLVILVLYWKIYKIARKRIQRRRQRPHFGVMQANNTNHQSGGQKKQKKKKRQKEQLTIDSEIQQEMLEKSVVPQKSKRQKRLKICFGISSSAATTTSTATMTQAAVTIGTTTTITTTTAALTAMPTTATMAAITTTTTTGGGGTAVDGTSSVGLGIIPTNTIATTGRNGVTISTTTTMECTDNRPLTGLGGVHTLGVNATIIGGAEETEYSTSNFDSKSHGTEVTTISSDADEQQTPQSNSEINTISHQVASTNSPRLLIQQKQQLKQLEEKKKLQQQLQQKHETQSQQQMDQGTCDTADISLNVPTGISSEPNSGEAGANKLLTSIPNPLSKIAKRRQLLEARRERKAAQTLAIITGAFVVCWLPFFVMALLLPLCKDCNVSPTVASIFLWLGYFNSTLNPVIYTVFNPEFRRAFQRIVFGRKTLPHAAASRKM